MDSRIIDEFMETLIGAIPDDNLRIVSDKLAVFFYDYDVQQKCTSVSIREDPVPIEVSMYLAGMRVSGSSEGTIKQYKRVLEMFFTALNKKLSEVKKDDIVFYLSWYKETRNVSNSTLDTIRTVICTFFKWCNDSEYISKNPGATVRPIKFQKEHEIPLTDFQVESVRANCKTKRDLALIDFLLSTGCRITETLNIRIGDVNFKEQKLVVLGKGNKKRTVYINGRAAHSINEYLKSRGDVQPEEYLFVSLRKPYKKLEKEAIEKMFRILGKESGIAHLHPHLFRKTMSTSALRKGMDITVVQKVLGHSNIETTMRYVTVTEEDVENAHRRFVS